MAGVAYSIYSASAPWPHWRLAGDSDETDGRVHKQDTPLNSNGDSNGSSRLLKRLGQLAAEFGDQLAQGGDGTGCAGARGWALAGEMAAAGLQYLFAAR